MVKNIVALIFSLSTIGSVKEKRQSGLFFMGFLGKAMMEKNQAQGFCGFLETNIDL